MKIILTNKHKIPFFIDDEDEKVVTSYSWYIDSNGYLRTNIPSSYYSSGQEPIRLHQFLMGIPEFGKMWDHINRNRLDNQKENFKLVDSSRSNRNRKSWG